MYLCKYTNTQIHKCGIMYLCKPTKVDLWNCDFVELCAGVFAYSVFMCVHSFMRLFIDVLINELICV